MSDKVKVVQLITTMADGGAETLVKDYALLCDREKIDMRIVTWSEPLGSANERILSEAGIKVLHLGEKNAVCPTKNLFVKIYRRVNKFRTFRKLITEERIDVIHIHLRFGRYLRAIPSHALKRLKLIYTLHNEPSKYFDPDGNRKQRFEFKEAKRLSDKYGLMFITLHEEMNKQVRKLFGTENVLTINNGINFTRFDKNLYDAKAVRRSLGIGEDVKVIGHVGSYTEQKNHEFLLKVFKDYLKKDPDAVLLIVGKGVLKEVINDKIREMGLSKNVVSLENRSDIPALMSAMDVFVLPSRWEGFPVVMIEAQKMGLACVISDKINKEVVLSDNVTMLDIDSDTGKWIEAIDGRGEKMPPAGNFEDYDILRSIESLQRIYCGE